MESRLGTELPPSQVWIRDSLEQERKVLKQDIGAKRSADSEGVALFLKLTFSKRLEYWFNA
jgi:hypothetical protein